jgi:D-aminopeptidase
MSQAKLIVSFDDKKVERIFDQLNQCHLPGAAVGIAVDGRTLYRKGFGLANAELPLALSPTLRMRLYSVTKHFTCLALLLLCEEGAASVEDPIGKYLPDLHPTAQGVTALQLMNNTSGLRDANDIAWIFSGLGESLTSEDLYSLYRTMGDVNRLPDTLWNYNNGGFVLLSYLIERVSGRPLKEVLEQRIFGPVGMNDTVLRRTSRDFLPNSASTHMPNPTGFDKREYSGERAGENGVVSTVDDMLRWLAHMDAPVVGSFTTWEAMKKTRILMNGSSTGYGAGLFVGKYRGADVIFHGGGGVNGNSFMLKMPAARLDIVVLANRGDVDSTVLATQAIDAIVPDLEPVEPRPKRAPLTGTFAAPASGRLVQLFAENGEQRASIDNYNFPMDCAEDGRMQALQPFPLKQSIAVPVGETVDQVVLNDYGNEEVLRRIQDMMPPPIGSMSGRYAADCGGIEATLYQTDRGLEMKTVSPLGSARFELEFLGEGFWRAKTAISFFGGIVSFPPSRDGFRFTTARSGALHFQRV